METKFKILGSSSSGNTALLQTGKSNILIDAGLSGKKLKFLLSEEGTQTIYSFSKNNSPLYSDVVDALAINNNSGEVYMASRDGILGFKSTATSANFQFKTLEVFPNPVRPEYQGNIAVRGMMKNSEVKIVDASGSPIKTVFSNGGQAIWDGFDNNNQQVGSGVYYFLATSQDGYSKAKSKVLIIR